MPYFAVGKINEEMMSLSCDLSLIMFDSSKKVDFIRSLINQLLLIFISYLTVITDRC